MGRPWSRPAAACQRVERSARAGAGEQGLFASVHNNCIINPNLAAVSERLSLAKVVPLAVDRAIAEIIFPTVERSVTIGRMTTMELVTKVGCAACFAPSRVRQ